MCTSSDEYNKYIYELKLRLSDLQIENIFGTTKIAMLDCSYMTEEEIETHSKMLKENSISTGINIFDL